MVFQIKLDLNKLSTNSEGERDRIQQPTNRNYSDFIQSVWKLKGWLVFKSGRIMGIRGLDAKTVKVTQTYEEDVFQHTWGISSEYGGIRKY